MNRVVGYCTLIACALLVLVLSAAAPEVISDSNTFLRKFVNHEFLNILGVILAITLASSAQLHLTLNQIEEKYDAPGGLRKTRTGVHQASYWLIALFLFGVMLVVVKPLLAKAPWSEALVNGGALFIIVWNVLILITITRTIFAIEADASKR